MFDGFLRSFYGGIFLERELQTSSRMFEFTFKMFSRGSLKTDGPAQEGRMIELHCRDWWIIPMHWTCRWKTVQAPDLLVDEIVEGPITLFIHEHRFERRGPAECIMHDAVTYQWGRAWWGRLVSETGVRVYLTLLFKYRHHRTRKWAMTK